MILNGSTLEITIYNEAVYYTTINERIKMNLVEWLRMKINRSVIAGTFSLRYGEYYTNIFLNKNFLNFNDFKKYFDKTLKDKTIGYDFGDIYFRDKPGNSMPTTLRISTALIGGLKLVNNKPRLTIWFPGAAAKLHS